MITKLKDWKNKQTKAINENLMQYGDDTALLNINFLSDEDGETFKTQFGGDFGNGKNEIINCEITYNLIAEVLHTIETQYNVKELVVHFH